MQKENFLGTYKNVPFYTRGQFMFLHWCHKNNRKVELNKSTFKTADGLVTRKPIYRLPEIESYIDVRPYNSVRSRDVNRQQHLNNKALAKEMRNFNYLYDEKFDVPDLVTIANIVASYPDIINVKSGLNINLTIKNPAPFKCGIPRWLRSWMRDRRNEIKKVEQQSIDGSSDSAMAMLLEKWGNLLRDKHNLELPPLVDFDIHAVIGECGDISLISYHLENLPAIIEFSEELAYSFACAIVKASLETSGGVPSPIASYHTTGKANIVPIRIGVEPCNVEGKLDTTTLQLEVTIKS